MSEKRFKLLGDGVFANSLSPSEICERLNEQQATINKLKEENEQLKEERNYFERKKCEYFNKYNKKHLDNIQLKEENASLKQRIRDIKYNNCGEKNGSNSKYYLKEFEVYED